MIQAENITKTYNNVKALDGLTLHAGKGSVYGLIGPNGAGKTTLIKQLAGVCRPDSGEIRINGVPVFENATVKNQLFYISDNPYFYPSSSIRNMAKFYAGLYPSWSWERFESLKELFGMDTSLRIRQLSKGMRKQAAFWIGIAAQPAVMILDEPMDGLDPVIRRSIWKLLMQDVCEKQMTVLVSSHNLRELEDVCDHAGILFNGKIVLEKSLDDLKGSVQKIQVAFSEGLPPELENTLDILRKEQFGTVWNLIVRSNPARIREIIAAHKPLVCDILPLTLEEVFIYELGGMGYEIENIIL